MQDRLVVKAEHSAECTRDVNMNLKPVQRIPLNTTNLNTTT